MFKGIGKAICDVTKHVNCYGKSHVDVTNMPLRLLKEQLTIVTKKFRDE